MSKVSARTYSRHSKEAIRLLALLIRTGRKELEMTSQEVADRAGISRGLLQRMEKGDPRCELGATIEVASIVGVKLFDVESTSLSKNIRQAEEKLTLLPKSVRKKAKAIDEDF
ncbi:MAG: helix-turn-helix domain-containing protein [Pseudomonadota bacterium]